MPNVRTMDFYDRSVTELIVEKYGIPEMIALDSFIMSNTYQMLLDEETDLQTFSPYVIFDMWECEKVTGDPRKSQYIRG